MTVTECNKLRSECRDCMDRNFCKVRYENPPDPENKSLRALLERCDPYLEVAEVWARESKEDCIQLRSDIKAALGRESE